MKKLLLTLSVLLISILTFSQTFKERLSEARKDTSLVVKKYKLKSTDIQMESDGYVLIRKKMVEAMGKNISDTTYRVGELNVRTITQDASAGGEFEVTYFFEGDLVFDDKDGQTPKNIKYLVITEFRYLKNFITIK
ncbi:hypothetical protein FRY74_06305 [Vicingus serpentipes]|uniref:Uncharacterized protein n=1 Tax=Vicingus serpentipes TaxID=1926625 RepID=A0A5C6RV09_9FLAO|nr:hypothetical protein [Vicingus serpentipes]TXB66181.1 hypothetical protein FRY74_06305 [Vicingus serpentipes]